MVNQHLKVLIIILNLNNLNIRIKNISLQQIEEKTQDLPIYKKFILYNYLCGFKIKEWKKYTMQTLTTRIQKN